MALVSSLEFVRKERQSIHQPTRCLSSAFTVQDGRSFIQLDTYGTDERAHPEKVSQSIQFDKQAATQLLALIRETFPDLD